MPPAASAEPRPRNRRPSPEPRAPPASMMADSRPMDTRVLEVSQVAADRAMEARNEMLRSSPRAVAATAWRPIRSEKRRRAPAATSEPRAMLTKVSASTTGTARRRAAPVGSVVPPSTRTKASEVSRNRRAKTAEPTTTAARRARLRTSGRSTSGPGASRRRRGREAPAGRLSRPTTRWRCRPPRTRGWRAGTPRSGTGGDHARRPPTSRSAGRPGRRPGWCRSDRRSGRSGRRPPP